MERVPRGGWSPGEGETRAHLEAADDGEAAHELGDQAVLDEVHVLHLLQHLAGDRSLPCRGPSRSHRVSKPYGRRGSALRHLAVQANEGASAYEQHVGRVEL